MIICLPKEDFPMDKDNRKHQKHLTLQDRYDIEDALNHDLSFKRIASIVGKDTTTISKEIRKHRIGDSIYNLKNNDCSYRYQCQQQRLCNTCDFTKRCSTCRKCDCRKICSYYRSDMCRNTTRAPYVCNGCNQIYECHKVHFFYRANAAHDAYISQLRNSREGICLSHQQLYELDCLITPLLKQGQSIAHIYSSHSDEIPCSMKTIYNYIDQGIFTARNIDLPKKVKYRPRKKRKSESTIDYSCREGRTYKDFLTYMSENADTNVVEMDTVHGSKKRGKTMLTFLFRNCNLMIIILIDACTRECVEAAIDNLSSKLGVKKFRKIFPVILTDNGPEFKGPDVLEKTKDGEERTKVFFCDPLASWQNISEKSYLRVFH